MGTNINSYIWLPFTLKTHSVKCISLVPELGIKSHTEFPPWNEIKVSPPTEPTCQKLRMDGPDLGGSLVFMTTAWLHHESVMRTPPSRRDQAQSPEIAMKYSIVFTHCNLIPQKKTEKRGCKCSGSWDLSPSSTLAGAGQSRARKEGKRERKTNATKSLRSWL